MPLPPPPPPPAPVSQITLPAPSYHPHLFPISFCLSFVTSLFFSLSTLVVSLPAPTIIHPHSLLPVV